MTEALAWTVAIAGLALGGLGAFVPGFPGSAVALLGLVAFAGLTGFEVVPQPALVLATLLAGAASVGQLLAPVLGSRVLGGTAGAATGAAIGAALGTLVPLPGAGWLGATVGALGVGLLARDGRVFDWLRGVIGAGGGCLISVGVDLLGVVAVAAVLALGDFLRALG